MPGMPGTGGGYLDSEIFIPPTTYISYAKIFLLFKKIASQSIFIASRSCSACDAIGVQYLCSACYDFDVQSACDGIGTLDVQSACDGISVLWVDRKTGRIVLACTEDEAAKIRELAAKSGKTVSRFMVDAVLNGDKN